MNLTGQVNDDVRRAPVGAQNFSRRQIFELIINERSRQDSKWNRSSGLWDDPANSKLMVVAEELGEIARAVHDKDADNLVEELVQTAAVIVCWLENMGNTNWR